MHKANVGPDVVILNEFGFFKQQKLSRFCQPHLAHLILIFTDVGKIQGPVAQIKVLKSRMILTAQPLAEQTYLKETCSVLSRLGARLSSCEPLNEKPLGSQSYKESEEE